MEISKRIDRGGLDTLFKMIIIECEYCGKYGTRKQRNKNNIYYCNASCQMNYAYENGLRDKDEIVKKARKVAHGKQKEHNWLNNKSSRDKLKEVMQTDEYRKHASDIKIGELNPMYGKTGELGGNYQGGSHRSNGTSFRGFDWKKIKKHIKGRDDYKCRKCGIDEEDCEQNLQVHHIIPFKCTQDNSDDNLITLCSKCHANVEGRFYKVKSISKKHHNGKVYNLSVKGDETYTANNMVVHNCRTVIRFLKIDK